MDIDSDAINELESVLDSKFKKDTVYSPEAKYGTYLGKDDNGDAWVLLAGNSEPTPLTNQTVNASVGDTIMVTIANGAANNVGDVTSPSITQTEFNNTTNILRQSVQVVREEGENAKAAAEEAKAVAEATNQHFWDDDNGAHVTDVTKDEWKTAADNNFPDLSDNKPYHNSLWNSLGMLFRRALNNLVSISRSAIAFFDGDGNQDANIVAQFGKDGFRTGLLGESHLVGDYHSLQLVDNDGATYFHVSDLRDRQGYAQITDTFTANGTDTNFVLSLEASGTDYAVYADGTEVTSGISKYANRFAMDTAPTSGTTLTAVYQTTSRYAKAYTLGTRTGTVGASSVALGSSVESSGWVSYAEGSGTKATASASHAEGASAWATGKFAHAEGNGTRATGQCSHAEGNGTRATGNYSHAEGCNDTHATGEASHAEGNSTAAHGKYAHSEGSFTVARGYASHAEGSSTTAYGDGAHSEGISTGAGAHTAHAQNWGTLASSASQTALGRYNVEDTNDVYAVIVGNGTNNGSGVNRSNALTVDWSGNVECGTVNGVDMADVMIGKAALLEGGSSIPANADLNTYVNVGTYFANSTNAAQLAVTGHAPTSTAFKMIVESSLGSTTYIRQRLQAYNSVVEFSRHSTNGGSTWVAWYRSSARTTANYASNLFLATPNGSAGYAGYRAIAADDLPTVPISKGGTGATTAANAKAALSLGTAAQNLGFSNPSSATQILFGPTIDVANANNTYSGKRVGPVWSNASLGLYNFTDQQSIWWISIDPVNSTATNQVTLGSAYTVTTCNVSVWNGVAMIDLTFKNTNALSANTQYNIGTIASGKRPAYAAFGGFTTGSSIYGNVLIGNNGAIYIRPTTSVAANTTIRIGATYILA